MLTLGVGQILRHFGSGVIISTAFIHLLMHAFVMFNNECLGHLEYEAVAPAIAMASLMVIFAIDFLAARWLAKRSALHAHKEPHSPSTLDEKNHFGHDHDFSGIDEGVLAGRDTARARWEVKLLEAGICFHSIMIGRSDRRSLECLRERLTFPGTGVTLGAQGGGGFVSCRYTEIAALCTD